MNSDDPVQFVSELNQFYARFDVTDFSGECDHVCDGLVPSALVISEPEVMHCSLHVNPHKTLWPEGWRLDPIFQKEDKTEREQDRKRTRQKENKTESAPGPDRRTRAEREK